MGQKICLEERTIDPHTQDKWNSHGNAYRSDYFLNRKTGEDFKSIEIDRVRNAKMVTINDCDGSLFIFDDSVYFLFLRNMSTFRIYITSYRIVLQVAGRVF